MKKLCIWIFQTGEPLPGDNESLRPMRALNLANKLIEKGHQVVIWSAAFSHQEKRHRTHNYQIIKINKNLELRLIPSSGYKKNISIKRLVDHFQLAINLKKILNNEPQRPNIAYVGYPPIEFAAVATKWLNKNKIPTILDVKDQWPEIFIRAFPSLLQPFVKILFWPYFSVAKKTIHLSTGVTSMTISFLEWIYTFSERKPSIFDRIYPLSPIIKKFNEDEIKIAALSLNIKNDKIYRNRFFFVGSISQVFDFYPILYAAKKSINANLDWQFIICGSGDKLEELKILFSELDNVVFTGWISELQIRAVSKLCSAALAPYKNLSDFEKSIPNKVIDYMALGQPIITPLRGEVTNLISLHNIGITYLDEDGDSLFNALLKIAQNDNFREELSLNAQKLYDENYDGNMIYSDFVNDLVKLEKFYRENFNAYE